MNFFSPASGLLPLSPSVLCRGHRAAFCSNSVSTTSDMLMLAWAWLLQLSPQDPPPGPPGLETCLGLTWDIYFHSLQPKRWREAQKSKAYPTSISAEEVGREGWPGESMPGYTENEEPCSHPLSRKGCPPESHSI